MVSLYSSIPAFLFLYHSISSDAAHLVACAFPLLFVVFSLQPVMNNIAAAVVVLVVVLKYFLNHRHSSDSSSNSSSTFQSLSLDCRSLLSNSSNFSFACCCLVTYNCFRCSVACSTAAKCFLAVCRDKTSACNNLETELQVQ